MELWSFRANTTDESDYVRINVVKGHFHQISEDRATQPGLPCVLQLQIMARLACAAAHNANANDVNAEMCESTMCNTLLPIRGEGTTATLAMARGVCSRTLTDLAGHLSAGCERGEEVQPTPVRL